MCAAAVQTNRIAVWPRGGGGWAGGSDAVSACVERVNVVGELLEAGVVVGFSARSRDGGFRGVRARSGRMRHRGHGRGCGRFELPAIVELVTSDGEDTSAVRRGKVR